MRDRILAALCMGFIAGAFAQTFVTGAITVIALFVLVAGVGVCGALALRSSTFILLAILCIGGAFGSIRYEYAERSIRDDQLVSLAGDRVTIRGFVADEPDERDAKTLLVVHTKSVNDIETDVRVRVSVPAYPVFTYGDTIIAEGTLRVPKPFEGDDGRTFDYERFLAKDHIGYEIAFPEVSHEEGMGGSVIKRALYETKHGFIGSLGRSIEEPESSLVAGMLLGAKQSLGDRLLELLRDAGIVHVIVLSGYNITIVAEAIMRATAFLPRAVSFFAGSVSIVLFATMAGAGSTVVRASIMALLVVLARALGRPNDLLRGLFIAGVLMVVHNPHILRYDLSFQLSFLATLGLIVFAPHVERVLVRVTDRFGLRAIIAATISAELFVLPLLLYSIGDASVVGLVTNILVLPFVPLIMALGFFAGLTGVIHPILAFPFGALAQALSAYVLGAAEVLGALQFAAVSVPTLSPAFLIVAYGLLGVLVWWVSRRASSSSTASSRSTSLLLR